MTIRSLATVKAQLSAFVDSVEGTHERVVITRNGEPAAVLISPEDLESLEETIAILSDPEAMAEIDEARRHLRGSSSPSLSRSFGWGIGAMRIADALHQTSHERRGRVSVCTSC